ncbi:MAG: uracil-DNA glycosylase [Planctomycetales bacterium]|nr:uracil-DNA glycosylase [Planctomycetales bacterium]
MSVEALLDACQQVLMNYRRCGLMRYSLTTAKDSAAIRQMCERLQVNTVCEDSPGEKVHRNELGADPSNSIRAIQSSVDGQVVQSSQGNQIVSVMPSPGQWTLPVLGDVQRQERFVGLKQEIQNCRACSHIVPYRQQIVFGEGPLAPTVCFMGEAPGADEDRTGRPFVGKAGQLLTKIIEAMKLKRDEVFILNALKCRPPQNRTPVQEEIDHCHHFVATQLNVLQPKYIVCLGAVAVRSLLGGSQSIGQLRGRFYDYGGAKVLVTYHPSYLLRNESAKKLVWADMQILMRELGLN